MTSPTATDRAPEAPPARAKPRWTRIVLVQVLVLVVGLTLAEIGTRIWMRMHGEPFDAALSRARIALFMSRAVDLVPHAPGADANLPQNLAVQVPVLQPFTGYIVTGMVGQLDHDLEVSRASAGGSQYEILVVGGSVAAVFGAVGEKHFLERLKADPLCAGRDIRMYWYGIGGFKQPQMVNLVQYMLALGFTPECVIDIDGFNEVALGNANALAGSNPLLPSISQWQALTSSAGPDREAIGSAWAGLEEQAAMVSLGRRALATGVCHSALMSALVVRSLSAHEVRAHAAFDEYTNKLRTRSADLVQRGPRFQPGAQAAVESSVKCWEESSRSLRAMCEARGILYVHVLQPTLHDVGSKKLGPKEQAEGQAPDSWVEGVHIGYPLLREAGERLRAEGEHFVDATMIFADVDGRVYFDECHFGETGNRLLAERLGDELLACMRTTR